MKEIVDRLFEEFPYQPTLEQFVTFIGEEQDKETDDMVKWAGGVKALAKVVVYNNYIQENIRLEDLTCNLKIDFTDDEDSGEDEFYKEYLKCQSNTSYDSFVIVEEDVDFIEFEGYEDSHYRWNKPFGKLALIEDTYAQTTETRLFSVNDLAGRKVRRAFWTKFMEYKKSKI